MIKLLHKEFDMVIEGLVLASMTKFNPDIENCHKEQAQESIDFYLKRLCDLCDKTGRFHNG